MLLGDLDDALGNPDLVHGVNCLVSFVSFWGAPRVTSTRWPSNYKGCPEKKSRAKHPLRIRFSRLAGDLSGKGIAAAIITLLCFARSAPSLHNETIRDKVKRLWSKAGYSSATISRRCFVFSRRCWRRTTLCTLSAAARNCSGRSRRRARSAPTWSCSMSRCRRSTALRCCGASRRSVPN